MEKNCAGLARRKPEDEINQSINGDNVLHGELGHSCVLVKVCAECWTVFYIIYHIISDVNHHEHIQDFCGGEDLNHGLLCYDII